MDGYTLAAQLRRTRRRYRLSAASQALYYELVAIANEEGWPDTFKCSNSELCNSLSINEKTLITVRLDLIQSGLIEYASGKSQRKVGQYTLITTVKFTADSTVNLGVKSTADLGAKMTDLIKLKEKPKQKEEVAVAVVTDYVSAFDFFKSTKNKRLLMEKHTLTDKELERYFLVFYDSKVDLGDLNGKTIADIARNFYYWLPKHIAGQQVSNDKCNANRPAPIAPPPTRGVAAAMQFTDVQMRE